MLSQKRPNGDTGKAAGLASQSPSAYTIQKSIYPYTSKILYLGEIVARQQGLQRCDKSFDRFRGVPWLSATLVPERTTQVGMPLPLSLALACVCTNSTTRAKTVSLASRTIFAASRSSALSTALNSFVVLGVMVGGPAASDCGGSGAARKTVVARAGERGGRESEIEREKD